MAAATANRVTEFKDLQNAVYSSYLVAASTTIYQGTLVMLNTSGYLVPAADTASCKVVGWADEKIDNSAGSAGDKSCRVISNVTGKMTASSVSLGNLDAPLLYVVDDQTVDETTPANSVKAGAHVTPFISSTEAWVFIPAYGFHLFGL